MYAAKCDTPDGSHVSFQNLCSIPEMQMFITNAIVHPGGEAPRQHGCHLANDLCDLDLEPAQTRHLPSRATRRCTGGTQVRQPVVSHTITSLQQEEDNPEDLPPLASGRSRPR